MSDPVTFVLCIENNAICAQALLLCESIRRYCGEYRAAPIIAVCPRRGHGVNGETLDRLKVMDVQYVEEPLNLVCLEYGSANRVFAAAWAEAHATSEWIVVLDSDTVFLGELELPTDADVAVRPVDSKGSATEGPGDPFEAYWTQLAEIQGISLDRIPFVPTTDGRHRVRASYNAGLVVVRRRLGLLKAWANLFAHSVAADLKPWRGSDLNVRASTGDVGIGASEYWGSNQAALALAMWSTTARVLQYPEAYNVPLHLLVASGALKAGRRPAPPIHVHYHWLFAEAVCDLAIATLRDLGADEEHLDWLSERLPFADAEG